MYKVFIDGKEGTTGLQIYERLAERDDTELLTLPDEERKDPHKRAQMLNASDISFLCLPDAAAVEAVSFVENPKTRIIDASTAHRTNPGWAYGFPELSPAHFDKIKNSNRVAVPGCHASGFVSLVYPLAANGILKKDARLHCFSLTGYSGGGKKMIAEYEASERSRLFDAPRQYALSQSHKHLKEMQAVPGLSEAPMFSPVVCDFYSGMEVTVQLSAQDLCEGKTISDIDALYSSLYSGNIVRYVGRSYENGLLSALGMEKKDGMEIFVEGNEDRILLVSRFDNLGKGASGAAVECMNIMMGKAPSFGLTI